MPMDPPQHPALHDGASPPHVLGVELPPALAATLTAALTAAGVELHIAPGLAEALPNLPGGRHPTVVLFHAPGSPPRGLERIGLLARGGEGGVIVVLDTDAESARIDALDGGADDVVSVPVPPGELAARVRAAHRRLRRVQEGGAMDPRGPILLDPAHRCLVGPLGDRTPLSEAEFLALETLLDADGAPVSRDWLGRVALKRPLHTEDRSVDQLVLKLRRKLASAGASERTILSARRQGYVIADASRFGSLGAALPQPQPLRPLLPAGA